LIVIKELILKNIVFDVVAGLTGLINNIKKEKSHFKMAFSHC